ncbi:winged helix DNA-binding domain-containing protein [Streptomyces xinghaiensis]|uniref:winged helix DNA-binding domain-containing protein n=1 Tax=Streptomyces xinghaiensis TaxID=1038928 RepID=UPI00031E973E|nr:winged helix DNA-binding domain-containing protein [Streptomyces xinghaiensis]MZE81554.1 winged helix DNA-binding domain-containing protein [Streptomyces sp. SID5475]
MTDTPELDDRALNRATLERQLLLRRHDLTVPEALTHLVGLQAQVPNPPYLGLWTRLTRFALDDLTQLLERREAVRGGMMRGTLHVVTAEDFLALRPVLQPVFERAQRGFFRRATEGLDLAGLTAFAAEKLDEKPRNGTELKALLAERWPDRDARQLLYSVQYLLPAVYVPPGGTWGRGGSVPLTTVESWFGRPLPAETDPARMILRYLAAFGPASVKDVQAWSGLTRLAAPIRELRPQLRVFRAAGSGAELFDLPDAPRPGPDTPAPVRLLPEYDNLLVAYADRNRVISDEHRRITNTKNGMVAATVLVDGRVAGRWRLDPGRESTAVEVEPFRRLDDTVLAAVHDEATALLTLAAPDAPRHEVRVTDVAAGA